MTDKTIGAVLCGEIEPEDLLSKLARNGKNALALLAFMRYAEDNAQALGVSIGPDELDQVTIVESCARLGENRLYTRDTIKPDEAWSGIATQLGFDEECFGEFLESLTDDALVNACERCDLRPGDLQLENQDALNRAVGIVRGAIASAYWGIDHVPRTIAGIVAGIASARCKGAGSVCIPAVGQGDLAAALAWRLCHRGENEEPNTEVAAFAHDGSLRVLATMAAIIEQGLNGGARASIGLAKPLSADSAITAAASKHPFDVAACDWSALEGTYPGTPPSGANSPRNLEACLPWIEPLFEGPLAGRNPYAAESGVVRLSSCELMTLRLLSVVDWQRGCALAIVESHNNTSLMLENLRRVLLEGNVLDAVIEFEHIEGQSDRQGQGTSLWVMRFGRAAGERVLLARLGGDGFDRLCSELCGDGWNFYENLELATDENPVAERVVRMVTEAEPIDMVSVAVKPEDMLADSDCSFRSVSYQDNIDVGARLARKAGAWESIQDQIADAIAQGRECEDRFLEAIRGVEG